MVVLMFFGKVVECYPWREVHILRHDVNRGLPAARNTGLDIARGEYIFHWDSDDFAEPGYAPKSLYDVAKASGADYVWCDLVPDFRHQFTHHASTLCHYTS